MPAQYVAPSKFGLFRIVQHGGRWRSLLGDCELARHADTAAALAYLQMSCPRARLPLALEHWRYLAGPPARLAQAGANDGDWLLTG
ncbi:MAG: hypothetical protein BGP10_09500 [Rhodanobacter sp. 68-29]|uniref:hypothetical protein n=1 Tax=Rhodanobacter sp. PCA2 TaxID=2006117 RepID=UPI00086E02E4|nr:hypothetical protein [Rhodanobacter sp. PCA2]ODU73969.1 MAG: hypothetical protein ABT17_09720 [Rhodanobacter sp. SCN 69-32]OJY59136.1 MAG: hypothetical protein BGP10_09500 [Rhodanobacter sp. 68-29]